MHEAQDQVAILVQADQEIEGVALLWGASFAGALWRRRIGGHSRLDDFPLATFKVLRGGLGQACHSLISCLLNAGFDF